MPVARQSSSPSLLACMGGAYGNVPALEACIQDARSCGCDTLAFLGDVIGCCGHSDEAAERVREAFDVVVAGNHEQEAAAGSASCGCGYASAEDERISCLAFAKALSSLSEANRRWFGEWPDQRRLTVGGKRVLLCHGSPRRTNEFLYASTTPPSLCQAWLDAAGAAALVCTHTGLPWIQSVPGGRLAVNCGVVGKPDHDGDPAVHYAILRVGDGGVEAEIRRVTYDQDAWADQLAREGIDEVFLTPLRTGIWRSGLDSLPAEERAVSRREPRPTPVGPASPSA